MPVAGRLRRFPRGIGRPPAQMPLMQESNTNRMRRRLTGSSRRRISFGGLFSLSVSSFQMMQARLASGFKGKLSQDLVGRTVSLGDEGAASRREAAPAATRARPIAPGRVANLVSKPRWISGFCCCFGVLYVGEVSGESCPLLLLMGKNSF